MGGFLFLWGIYLLHESTLNAILLSVQYSISENPASMTKSKLILALAIILFLSSCSRYITTYEAASRHNKCGKFIR